MSYDEVNNKCFGKKVSVSNGRAVNYRRVRYPPLHHHHNHLAQFQPAQDRKVGKSLGHTSTECASLRDAASAPILHHCY